MHTQSFEPSRFGYSRKGLPVPALSPEEISDLTPDYEWDDYCAERREDRCNVCNYLDCVCDPEPAIVETLPCQCCGGFNDSVQPDGLCRPCRREEDRWPFDPFED